MSLTGGDNNNNNEHYINNNPQVVVVVVFVDNARSLAPCNLSSEPFGCLCGHL